MLGFNSPNAMRLINHLYASHAPPPAPEAPPAPIRSANRKPSGGGRRRAPSPDTMTSDSDMSDSESSYSSDSSDYEDTDVIYHKVVEEAKCPRVSPAGLKGHSKSRKEAAKYLKSKECPEVPKLKKSKEAAIAAMVPMGEVKLANEADAAVVGGKKSRKPRVSHPLAPGPESSPAKREAAAAAAAAAATPAAPVASASKPKRAPSAWNKFAAEHMKAGKSMTEVAAMWKAKKGESV